MDINSYSSFDKSAPINPADLHSMTDAIFNNPDFIKQNVPFIGNAKQQAKLRKLMHELSDNNNDPQVYRKAIGYLVDLAQRCCYDSERGFWNTCAVLDFVHRADKNVQAYMLWNLIAMYLLDLPFPHFVMSSFISDALTFIDNDNDVCDVCDDCGCCDNCEYNDENYDCCGNCENWTHCACYLADHCSVADSDINYCEHCYYRTKCNHYPETILSQEKGDKSKNEN